MLIKRNDNVDTVAKAVVTNGLFKFKNVKLPVHPDFYLICVQTEFVENLKVFLDQAEDVKITGNLETWPNVTVTGSEVHMDYLACRKLRKELQAKDYHVKYPDGYAPADTVTFYTLKECRQMIEQKPNSYYLAWYLATLTHPLEDKGFTYRPDRKKPLYDLLSPNVKSGTYGKILAKQIADYDNKKLWFEKLTRDVVGISSISRDEVKQKLIEVEGKRIGIDPLPVSGIQLNDGEIPIKVKMATLILNMAYVDRGQVKVNTSTGYLIDENGICVTNYHVGKEYMNNNRYTSLSVTTADGKCYPVVDILSCSESDDLMIFKVNTKGDKLSALPLGNVAPESKPIHVMSHPKANFYSLTSGTVSGYSTATLAGKPCNIMSITADFKVGSSGGPIVDDYCNVVGTISRIDGGMKVGVPVSELKKLLVLK